MVTNWTEVGLRIELFLYQYKKLSFETFNRLLFLFTAQKEIVCFNSNCNINTNRIKVMIIHFKHNRSKNRELEFSQKRKKRNFTVTSVISTAKDF